MSTGTRNVDGGSDYDLSCYLLLNTVIGSAIMHPTNNLVQLFALGWLEREAKRKAGHVVLPLI